jgi:hypothetical protein
MNIETVFDFIKDRRGYDYPIRYKFINGMVLTDEDLNIDGDLDLSKTNITTLPNNIHVGGDLDLSFTKIKSLPNNLRVERDFFLLKTPLYEKYDEDDIRKMIEDKGGYINGEIYWW